MMRARLGGVVALVLVSVNIAPTGDDPRAATPNNKGKPAMSVMFMLEFKKRGVPLDIGVNDVWVERFSDTRPAQSGEVVNMWIRPGHNELRVRCPSTHAEAGAFADIRVTLRDKNNPKQEPIPVASFVWPSPAGPALPVPYDRRAPFEAAPPPPSELWGKAAPIDASPESTAAILGLVGELHAAFAARNKGRIGQLLEFKATDVGRSVYMDPDGAKSAQEMFFDEIGSSPKWKPEPWDPKHAHVDLVEAGLLAEVTAAGKPAIRVDTGESFFDLPVYVARLGGKWVVAR